MNSAFVLCAYFAMLLSPCFVATFGDLLSVRWIFALARRRRTNRAESFLVSFRQERYAMALADEAAFFAMLDAEDAAPQPFLVPRRLVPVETPAFLEARQRIATRLAQLTLVHKLRSAAEDAEPAVAPVETAASAGKGVHIRPVRVDSLISAVAAHEAAHTHLVRPSTVPTLQLVESLLVEVAPPRAGQGPEPVLPRHKPGESDAIEIAA